MRIIKFTWAWALPLLLTAALPLTATAAADVNADTHPLLTAVCRNDYPAAAELAGQNTAPELAEITWGRRELRALDLAVANGHWEIAHMLMNAGAIISPSTLHRACRLKHARALCLRAPELRHHKTCRLAQDPSRWSKRCPKPDRHCAKILE